MMDMFLRKLKESDLKERVAWMNHKDVYPSMGFKPPISLEATLQWYHANQTNGKRIDVVFVNEQGDLLAMAGLTNIDYTSRKAEFYLFVNPNRQRQGIGCKATTLLCKYAFSVLYLHKVYLYTNDSNIGAQKTYEKVGFTLEGRMRHERIAQEVYEDRLYYGILAGELQHPELPLTITD